MYCVEEKTYITVGIFRRPPVIRRPGHCCPLVSSLVWHFATKCAAVKFAEPWMSNHFPEEITATLSRHVSKTLHERLVRQVLLA